MSLSEHDTELLIVENWSIIFPELVLIERQYAIPDGVLDILAKDGLGWVVIKLKVDSDLRAMDTAVGQVMRYMKYIESKNRNPEKGVRAIIYTDFIPSAYMGLDYDNITVEQHSDVLVSIMEGGELPKHSGRKWNTIDELEIIAAEESNDS